jgi:hypothetical protein
VPAELRVNSLAFTSSEAPEANLSAPPFFVLPAWFSSKVELSIRTIPA